MNLKSLLVVTGLALTFQAEGKSLKIHEWGTFTSFQNSYGGSIEGIHRGDQQLPEFVYLRNPNYTEASHDASGCRRTSYACDFDPYAVLKGSNGLGINQRMETPVIYFHTDQAQPVQVQVDFPQGLITEWYPAAQSYAPAINGVRQIAGGSMTWNVQVHTDRLQLPEVPADSIWQPSREVDANDISVGAENERLIFYRGVGNFMTPFAVHSEAHNFAIENRDGMGFPNGELGQILYINTNGRLGFVRALGSMRAPGYQIVNYSRTADQPMINMNLYLSQAMKILTDALHESGLNEDEARAMANTWKQAYLLTPGERFLYILPQSWTERLLPMTLNPQPEELVRTLVGRVEVMNKPSLDAQYTLIEAHARAQTPIKLVAQNLGGFGEQKLLLVLDQAGVVFKERMGRVLNQPAEIAKLEQEYAAFQAYVNQLLDLIRF